MFAQVAKNMWGHYDEAQAKKYMTHLTKNKMAPLIENNMVGPSLQTQKSVLNYLGLGLASKASYLRRK